MDEVWMEVWGKCGGVIDDGHCLQRLLLVGTTPVTHGSGELLKCGGGVEESVGLVWRGDW